MTLHVKIRSDDPGTELAEVLGVLARHAGGAAA